MRTQDNQLTDTEMALVNTLSTLSLQAKCLCSNTRLSCKPAGKTPVHSTELKTNLSIEWALFNPEERSLSQTTADAQPERTQGERPCPVGLVHTSCRSESSNFSLVVLDNLDNNCFDTHLL